MWNPLSDVRTRREAVSTGATPESGTSDAAVGDGGAGSDPTGSGSDPTGSGSDSTESTGARARAARGRASANGGLANTEGETGEPETPDGGTGAGANWPARGVAVGAAALAGGLAYHALVRPWHRRWGATDEEARRSLPGDDLLPEATDVATRAVDVDAPAAVVWPLVVRTARSRFEGGTPGGDSGADRVIPKYRPGAEDEPVRLAPSDETVSADASASTDERASPASAPAVVHLDAGQALVFPPSGDAPARTRAFVVEETGAGTSRLLVRTRSVPERAGSDTLPGPPVVRRTLHRLVGEPAQFVAERRLLRDVERRAEEMARGETAATE